MATGLTKWKDLHYSSIVVDCHTDVVQQLYGEKNWFGERIGYRRLGERSTKGQLDIPRMIEGGVDCQVFAIWSDPKRQYDRLRRGLELLDCLANEISTNSSCIGLAKSYSDIIDLTKHGKIAALLSLEGGEPLSGEISMLRNFYRLGVRLIGLTWSFQNELGYGIRERPNLGLTEFGFKVVEEANALGMVVDVSHLNEAGFYDVIETSRKPIIASHSNSKSVHPHRRNLDDRQIKAIADKGGAIGINFTPQFLAEKNASIDDVIKHIKYIADLVGFDKIGLGSDFDGMENTTKGLEDVTKLPMLTKRMIESGFAERDIRSVLGESMLNVFREVLK
jgi:membrane dipeptidase